jgi:hypothetical protein
MRRQVLLAKVLGLAAILGDGIGRGDERMAFAA